MDDVLFESVERVAEMVRTRKVSPVELTRACLARIERYDANINAFITVLRERALARAKAAEGEIASGSWRGPLHGLPLAIKDLIDIAGTKTTSGSRVVRDTHAQGDSGIVQLLERAGAVIIGKTNLHEFAYGGSGVVTAYGATANPWNVRRTTGGSSSGSAAAVSAGMCFAAIGSDTAGSIRLPAAYCGLVGLKPSWGFVSTRGVVPLSESLDHVGPIARTVRDTEIALEAISDYRSGKQERDVWRAGIARKFFCDDLESGVAKAFEDAINRMRPLVRDLRDIDVPVDTDRTVFNYEVWQVHREHVQRAPDLYQPQTLERIRACAATTEDQYVSKKRELAALRQAGLDLFGDIDVILSPTVPISPPLLADLIGSPELRKTELLMLRNTRPFNVLGLPTITVPCGLAAGLPAGLQITAGTERHCIAFAKLCEQEFSFSRPHLPRA